MHALTERLNTPDKRIVAIVGALVTTSFLLVNYERLRELAGACVEAGHHASTGVLFDSGPVTDDTTYHAASAWLQELQTNFPWWCVFAGVSALIVARLLRVEVRMAEDLEGTI